MKTTRTVKVFSAITALGFAILIPALVFATGGCNLVLTKTASTETVAPGGQITYHLKLENIGTANCIGGGVRLIDYLDPNTSTSASDVTLTPADHPAEQVGLYPIYEPHHVEINLATMPPNDVVLLDIVATVSNDVQCGSTLTNKAQYYTASLSPGLSSFVEKNTLVQCAPPPQCSDGIDNDNDEDIDYPDDLSCDNLDDDDENTAPVITLVDDDPLNFLVGDSYLDLGATADDQEEGDITAAIVVGGETVTTTNTGSFLVTYNVVDSEGAAAPQVTRTVNIIAPDNACPFTPEIGRVIVDFSDGAKIRSDQSLSQATSGPINTTILAGTYKVSLASFDGYLDRIGDNQPNENWFAILENSSQVVANTEATTDLRDDLAFVKRVDVVNSTLLISQSVDMVTARHSVYPDNSSANSVEPVCAAFDPVPALPQCSDSFDNDGDGSTDYPNDPGCSDSDDDNENQPPAITRLGNDPINLIIGDSFTDPGATAADPEDGDLTSSIVKGGDTVDPNILGAYLITYDVADLDGLAAPQVTRTVNVNPVNPQCSDNLDNDSDGNVDFPNDPGCDDDNDNDENQPPAIILSGDNPLELNVGDSFTEPGFAAADSEDGDITADVVIGGDAVDTGSPASFTITYNVADSDALAAPQVTRIVNVSAGGGGGPTPECSDGLDNDGDGSSDAADSGCHTDDDPQNSSSYDPNDNNENSAPVVALIGGDISLTIGDSFTDPGATAADPEDGDLTSSIVKGGDTVDPNILGAYLITYDVADLDGLAAPQVTRTVNVNPAGGCVSNCGGGGGGLPNLEITNEILTVPSSGIAVVTWKTNIPATSQVVYDSLSHPIIGSEPDYGYAVLTTETTAINTIHRVEVTGLTPGTIYYFRPVSKAPNVPRGTGQELTFTLGGGPIIPTGGPTQCTYIEDYLRIDFNNNPEEVRKLQTFLRDFEGFTDLQITQVFDQATFEAVSAFQERYRSEVLDPWGLPDPTGYVYYTTQKKINEIFCAKEFPLTLAQLSEIDDFRALLETLRSQPGVPAEEIEGLEGQVGVAPAPGGGATLAVTGASNVAASSQTANLLEASGASGALGILPGATGGVPGGTQVGELIGTVGTSGALAIFGDGESGTTTSTTTLNSSFLATIIGNLGPSAGRGITILGIVILLLYLLLSRLGKKTQTRTEARNEYIPDVRDDGEGTILEV